MSLSLGTNIISTSSANALSSLPVETITESVTSSVTTNVLETIEPDNIVHKSGDETITGTKTFNANVWESIDSCPTRFMQNTSGAWQTEQPSSDIEMGKYPFLDSNESWCGVMECYAQADNYNMMRFNIQKNGKWCSTPLSLFWNGTTAAAYAPSPASASDNSKHIATTEWVNSRINAIMNNYKFVKETGSSNSIWYRIWTDGWIEQGGYGSINEQSTVVLTLPKTFSNTNYTVVASQATSSTAGDCEVCVGAQPTSTSQITIFTHYTSPNTVAYRWYACGF